MSASRRSGLTSYRGERVVGMQYDDPGSDGGDLLYSFGGEAEPEPVAEAGRQAADEAHLGRREPVRRLGAMQAQVTPTPGRGNKCGTELVTKAERRHDVAISGAASTLPRVAESSVATWRVPVANDWNLLTSSWPNSLSRN